MIPNRRPVELVLIGAGQRGSQVYGAWALAHPEAARIVGLAEPDPVRRAAAARDHGLDASRCFESWEPLLASGRMADGAIIATQDRQHVAPAIAALEAGYGVLLEKPMAHDLAGCLALARAAERTSGVLQICHVLRYAPFWRSVKAVLDSGRLGRIVTVEHRENVAWWHMAHSFVRGHWRSADASSPMILAKCCHDLDLLAWLLPAPVRSLSSVGSLVHFRPENVGPEIPARCSDGCPIEADCAFSALGIYLELRPFPGLRARIEAGELDPETLTGWPFGVLGPDPSRAGRRRALETGPYGRCVYRADNDVVDHQVVTMALEDGSSAVLVMHGHAQAEHRSMRYEGSRATLIADTLGEGQIWVHAHGGASERIAIPRPEGGHGGGDAGLMADFVRVLRGEIAPLTDARGALESHLLAFAAEAARLDSRVVHMPAFRRGAGLDRPLG